MIGELNLQGVYVPTLLVAAVIAGAANALLGRALALMPVYRWVWHRSLVDLALFIILLVLTDVMLRHMPALVDPFR